MTREKLKKFRKMAAQLTVVVVGGIGIFSPN